MAPLKKNKKTKTETDFAAAPLMGGAPFFLTLSPPVCLFPVIAPHFLRPLPYVQELLVSVCMRLGREEGVIVQSVRGHCGCAPLCFHVSSNILLWRK